MQEYIVVDLACLLLALWGAAWARRYLHPSGP